MSKHSLSYHPLYRIWAKMKTRCYNPNYDRYYDYGGRGISMCSKWKNNFKAFYDWAIINNWKLGLTIDRYPNNNGNYKPSNCRWVSRFTQMSNIRANVFLEFKGKRLTIAQVSRKTGVNTSTMYKRKARGFKGKEIIYGRKRIRRK